MLRTAELIPSRPNNDGALFPAAWSAATHSQLSLSEIGGGKKKKKNAHHYEGGDDNVVKVN